MEITYHWEGSYLIPDLKLSDITEYQISFHSPQMSQPHMLQF